MRDAQAPGHAGGHGGGSVGGRPNDRVDALGAGQTLDGRLVVGGDERPPVGVAEAGRSGIPIRCDDGQPLAPGRREEAELRRPRAEDEDACRSRDRLHGCIVPEEPEPGINNPSFERADPRNR
jgi:hypothetical protein